MKTLYEANETVLRELSVATEIHTATSIPVASGAGYVQCSCGWQSRVEDDGDMFTERKYNAHDAFVKHHEEALRNSRNTASGHYAVKTAT